MTKVDEITQSEGYQKAKQQADALKGEIQVQQAAANKMATVVQNLSKEAQAFMDRHRDTGVKDLNTGVSVPQLRIHSAGVSSKNQLADGNDPLDGQIFYTGTQEAFDKVVVVLLSIKKCRLEQKDEVTGDISMKATYLLAGLIEDTFQPFVIYVKGMSYNKIWNLEDQLKPFVTKRLGGIPMSMLKVVVSSTKETVEVGKFKGQKKNVFKFDLLITEDNLPVIEGDFDKLTAIENSLEKAEMMLDTIISQKGITEREWAAEQKDPGIESAVMEVLEAKEEPIDEPPANLSADEASKDITDDIPF